MLNASSSCCSVLLLQQEFRTTVITCAVLCGQSHRQTPTFFSDTLGQTSIRVYSGMNVYPMCRHNTHYLVGGLVVYLGIQAFKLRHQCRSRMQILDIHAHTTTAVVRFAAIVVNKCTHVHGYCKMSQQLQDIQKRNSLRNCKPNTASPLGQQQRTTRSII